jgi:hypothetical protein
MELPTYKLPVWRDFFLGLVSKAWAFLKRAGTIIFGTTVALWVLAYFPNGGTGLEGSYAGMIGRVIEPHLPSDRLQPRNGRRADSGHGRARSRRVITRIDLFARPRRREPARLYRRRLPAPGPCRWRSAFLAWYVYAPQCFATLATVPRDQLVEMDGLHVRLPDRPGLRRRHGSPSGSRPGPGCRRFPRIEISGLPQWPARPLLTPRHGEDVMPKFKTTIMLAEDMNATGIKFPKPSSRARRGQEAQGQRNAERLHLPQHSFRHGRQVHAAACQGTSRGRRGKRRRQG